MNGWQWAYVASIVLAAVLIARLTRKKNLYARLLTERTSDIADATIEVYERHALEHTAIPASRGGLQPSQPLRLTRHSGPNSLPLNYTFREPPDPWADVEEDDWRN